MTICTNPNHPFSYPPREQMYRDLRRAEERVERERAGYIGGIAYALRLLGSPQPGPSAARFVLEAMLDGDTDLYVSMADREMRSYRARHPATRHGGRRAGGRARGVDGLMRDHAEVSDIVRWPADSEWAWRVDMILATAEGARLLAISRGETEADVVTRVVRETEVSSNAFQLP